MKATGIYWFIKGGLFTNWTLLWITAAGSANAYPAVQAGNTTSVFTADIVRTPQRLGLPPLLAYDTFTRSNGAIGSTETVGPDGQTTPTRVWTGATFTVASNAAINTPTLGADVVVNGDFDADTDWGKGTGWTIAAGVASKAAGTGSFLTQAALVARTWYSGTMEISAFVAGSLLALNSQSGANANGIWLLGGYSRASTDVGLWAGSTANFSLDNIIIKSLTASEVFSSISVGENDVIADVNLTKNALSIATFGLVLCLDSAAIPANYLVCYLDRSAITLGKIVAGVFTQLITASITYSAGATLRAIKSGTSVSVYYNNAQVGTIQTVSDAGIISNTLHGLMSTDPLNVMDTFVLRSVDGAYNALDKYIK